MFKKEYMLIALQAAKQRQGFCAPNPSVGAVLVIDDRVIAVGYHQGAGKPHAEVEVLQDAAVGALQSLKTAELYVTLEPCCHHGRTPPCVDLIIQRGIKTVYFSQLDPNPQVAGKGQQHLRAAGVVCDHHPIMEIAEFYRPYCFWWQTGRPFVTVKIALSADRKIAGPDKQPVAITGAACHEITQQQRLHADALCTTVETIVHDNPRFNVRMEGEVIKKPLYVLDRNLRLPLDANVITTTQSLTLCYAAEHAPAEKLQALQQRGAHCVPIVTHGDHLDLLAVLQWIGQQGVHHLWVEVGAICLNALLKESLINQLIVYVSSKQLGKHAYGIDHFIYQAGQLHDIAWQDASPDQILYLPINK